ncbi:hypothetical protein D9619_009272 [Psilocybe cf. subviscida]|uniref:Myb-like domain-containing protein n=1 Tax=Psilocybe cf. subviscida TaxID=2480587 RepID=A0A8H5FAK6_9AGAR|nr:hypothetical protein D9619_009272 [Psilocybe cf. subviscida]
MASSSPPNNARSAARAVTTVPSSNTFSFKAPYPVSSPTPASVTALKHRRVSLASPSSPRIVKPHTFRDEMGLSHDASSAFADDADFLLPEKKGKMRKLDTSQAVDESSSAVVEKKPRKKWSSEETQMLVKGCNKYGVGNWKIILQDPELEFHDRSAVDLKDRFRTYFPDAYKKHYPNAKTHLSTKVRATFPDGSSIFEKTRSKRRRPFTDAEDRALKAGYDKHGTTWATIVKDPIFQEQNRRSTDLRDRFRNAFPDLYQAAGYKPRTAAKKKADGPVRAADDQLSMSAAGPVRSRRRAQSTQGHLRGGTKSVPQSTSCSADEESSGDENEQENSGFKSPPTPVFVDNVSTMPFRSQKSSPSTIGSAAHAPTLSSTARDTFSIGDDDDDDMRLITEDADPLTIPDFLPNTTYSDMETWPSGLNTPTTGASPTSSQSDFFMSQVSGGNHSQDLSNASSPFISHQNDRMIGNSAWGDGWFLPNPRMEPNAIANSSADAAVNGAGSSSLADGHFSPGSPYSFNTHLNHGVFERYGLFPYVHEGHMSEADIADNHTGFDEGVGPNGASAGGTGFKGYHSQIAGDLISGARAYHHHNQQGQFPAGGSGASTSLSQSLANMYNMSFGVGGELAGGGEISGLGLEGMHQQHQENAGVHPMQLHAHTPSLSSIDELGLTGISLDDHCDSSASSVSGLSAGVGAGGDADHDMDTDNSLKSDGSSNMLGMPFGGMQSVHSPPNRVPGVHGGQEQQETKDVQDGMNATLGGDLLGLEDLVHMNELHATPPATPLMTHPRPMRSSSGGNILNNFDHPGMHSSGGGHHARSISVPPTEARNGGAQQQGVPMSMDDVRLHMHPHTNMNFGGDGGALQQLDFAMMGRSLHPFFTLPASQNSSPGTSDECISRLDMDTLRLTPSRSNSSIHSPISPHHDRHSQEHSSQLTPLFSTPLILSPSPPSNTISNHNLLQMQNTNSNGNNTSHSIADQVDGDIWRTAFVADYNNYNLPFLDLHYYNHGNPTYGSTGIMAGHGNHNSLGLDSMDEYSDTMRQGQALDLAQSAALASSTSALGMGSLGLNLNLGLPLRAFDTPSPVGTIRHQPRETKRPSLAHTFAHTAPTPMQTSHAVASAAPPPAVLAPTAAQTLGRQQRERQQQVDVGMGFGVTALRSRTGSRSVSGIGSVRQSPGKAAATGSGAISRSMSHHRGQSAVNPQDLILRSDNKRKRASWDGGNGMA